MARRKPHANATAPQGPAAPVSDASATLKAPASGVTVRMYRQGHGDCFLLCAPREGGGATYMLIDCGLWNGSAIEGGPDIAEVIDDIAKATGGRLDVLAITHEHLDHVSGFLLPAGKADPWAKVTIGEVWLAWTEDGADPDANALRELHDDILLGLARVAEHPHRVGLDKDSPGARLIRELVTLHTGEEVDGLTAGLGGGLAADGSGLSSKVLAIKGAIQRMRHKAGQMRFMSPGDAPVPVPDAAGLRAYPLGPPRDYRLLRSLDPEASEGFHAHLDGPARTFLDALDTLDGPGEARSLPFDDRYGKDPSWLSGGDDKSFWDEHYGDSKSDTPHLAAWRRIDAEWLGSAEALALRLNKEVNNTSLVLAFELPRTGRVLLFTGDAQRGNWISWAGLSWDGGKVTARDLLARTVLYKVGHHGSHNATLGGRAEDAHPNLGWLGRGDMAKDFVAFIPSNRSWAYGRKWRHPLESIEKALEEKAQGRVFRTDLAAVPERPEGVAEEAWSRFASTAEVTRLYAQVTIPD